MEDDKKFGQDRREFLRSAVASTVAGTAIAGSSAVLGGCSARSWNHEADIVVVGSGAAALTAAIAAIDAGRSVILLESAPSPGGTTVKSDGGYWIPDNRLMRDKGVKDDKDEAIAFMLRHAYPAAFNPAKPKLGMEPLAYDLIETFFDNAASIVGALEKAGVLRYTGFPLIDYYDGPDNKSPYGRTLLPQQQDGALGGGRELIRQLQAPLTKRNVPLLLKHRVIGLERNSQGAVVGVVARQPDGEVRVRARKAVIFGTGGFSQNEDLVTRFQPGPIYGGCAVPTNQGDFVRIGTEAGAMLGNMASAWRAQVVLDDVVKQRSLPRDIFHLPGDSMLIVNRFGERVLNEKRNYNDRAKVHYDWNAAAAEQSNRLLFMVYDRRCRDMFAGNPPIPPKGEAAAHELSAASLAGLRDVIQQRLDVLAKDIGPYALDAGFSEGLRAEVAQFNRMAATGKDTDFERGATRYDQEWHTGYAETKSSGSDRTANIGPDKTLFPLSSSGPYYAVILAPGALDTNGGPQIDVDGRVIDFAGKPIAGLYGAGNCIASPAGGAYWGAGTTLGLAITFGTLAGRAAAREPDKSEA